LNCETKLCRIAAEETGTFVDAKVKTINPDSFPRKKNVVNNAVW
jgi:hypothetical protein